MGISGDKEGAPPEPLVLGARLHCNYGEHDTFLTVETDFISINKLPNACVEDSKVFFNIQPFGKCNTIYDCENMIVLEDKWVNEEPQNTGINGKEIITTKSRLICKGNGMEITVRTSGQDGIFARQLLLIKEIDEKYPSLRAILEDPNQSLYLKEGKYKLAIQFLEDQINKRGGKIAITDLYSKDRGLEEEYIRSALDRLLTGCDTTNPSIFIQQLINAGIMNKIDIEQNGNQDYLNALTIELLKKEGEKTTERIKNSPIFRAEEENKAFYRWLESGVETAQYCALMYSSMVAGNMKKAKKTVDKNAEYEKTGREVVEAEKGASGAVDDVVKEIPKPQKPNQVHHYATNKSKTYTKPIENITKKYDLDLDGSWNKDLLPHQGRHPNAYHDYVLNQIKQYDSIARGNKDVFLKLFENFKNEVKANSDMLYKNYWLNK